MTHSGGDTAIEKGSKTWHGHDQGTWGTFWAGHLNAKALQTSRTMIVSSPPRACRPKNLAPPCCMYQAPLLSTVSAWSSAQPEPACPFAGPQRGCQGQARWGLRWR